MTLVDRLGSLGLHDLDEWDVYCHWHVSKRLGGKVEEPRASVAIPVPVVPKPAIGTSPDICDELREAQHDTQKPDRFEAAVGVAFVELGFDTQHIGGSGEADVVARADLGDERFTAVVDAKTCQPGVPKNNINYDPIKGHQEQHEADFAVVVASAFSQGNTVQHAVNRSVGLLTTDRLIELVRLSRSQALSLYLLKEILGQVGLIQTSLDLWRRGREDYAEAAGAVLKVFESHQRGEELSGGLTEESVFWLLKGGGGKFPRSQIGQVIRFLSDPILGVLEERGGGYVLTVPATSAYRRLSSFAGMMSGI
jgi:hypothetical protein